LDKHIPELLTHKTQLTQPQPISFKDPRGIVLDPERNMLQYLNSTGHRRKIEIFPDETLNPEYYEEKGYEMILPMKAKDYVKSRHSDWWEDPSVAVQLKHDGIRGTLHVRNNINRFFTGREVKNGWTGEKTDRLPHLRDYNLYEFRGTVLDGEVISPHGVSLADFKYVTSVVGSKPLKAVQKQLEGGFLVFTAFDIIYYKGFYVGHMPYSYRVKLLNKVLYTRDNKLRNPYVVPTYTFTSNPVVLCGETLTTKKDFYKYLLDFGVEGVMLRRDKELIYRYDHKSSDMLKLKVSVTLDLVCVGFTEANEGKTGQFKGLIGAMQIGMYVSDKDFKIFEKNKYKEVTEYKHLNGETYKLDKVKGRKLVLLGKTSGMTVDERKHMTANPDKYLSEVVEVKCNQFFDDTYVPRNPRFMRMHHNKSANKVTFEAHKEQAETINEIE
jgi:ATP-dependent DNA ligase